MSAEHDEIGIHRLGRAPDSVNRKRCGKNAGYQLQAALRRKSRTSRLDEFPKLRSDGEEAGLGGGEGADKENVDLSRGRSVIAVAEH